MTELKSCIFSDGLFSVQNGVHRRLEPCIPGFGGEEVNAIDAKNCRVVRNGDHLECRTNRNVLAPVATLRAMFDYIGGRYDYIPKEYAIEIASAIRNAFSDGVVQNGLFIENPIFVAENDASGKPSDVIKTLTDQLEIPQDGFIPSTAPLEVKRESFDEHKTLKYLDKEQKPRIQRLKNVEYLGTRQLVFRKRTDWFQPGWAPVDSGRVRAQFPLSEIDVTKIDGVLNKFGIGGGNVTIDALNLFVIVPIQFEDATAYAFNYLATSRALQAPSFYSIDNMQYAVLKSQRTDGTAVSKEVGDIVNRFAQTKSDPGDVYHISEVVDDKDMLNDVYLFRIKEVRIDVIKLIELRSKMATAGRAEWETSETNVQYVGMMFDFIKVDTDPQKTFLQYKPLNTELSDMKARCESTKPISSHPGASQKYSAIVSRLESVGKSVTAVLSMNRKTARENVSRMFTGTDAERAMRSEMATNCVAIMKDYYEVYKAAAAFCNRNRADDQKIPMEQQPGAHPMTTRSQTT